MPPEKMAHWHCPAPSPESTQSKSIGPLAQRPPLVVQPALPQAIWRLRLDGRPIGPDWVVAQSGPTGWSSKEQVTYPRAMVLKPRAPFLQLPEFGKQLTHNLHPEGLIARAP
jgi:hypothetical protein